MPISSHSVRSPSRTAYYLYTLWNRFFGLNISPIEPLLFVGGQFSPTRWPALYRLGIRAVLSLQAESEDRFHGPPPERTLRLMVTDFTAPSMEQLAAGVAFIAAAHNDNLPVFVHCHAGVGRAPTTAAAYLIAQRGLSPAEALTLLRVTRPIIALTPEQKARLYQWAEWLRK